VIAEIASVGTPDALNGAFFISFFFMRKRARLRVSSTRYYVVHLLIKENHRGGGY